MHFDLSTLIEILFPQSEDEKTVASCTSESFKQKMRPRMVEGVYTLTSFSDNEIRAVIHLVKFHKNNHAVTLLSALLQKYLNDNHSREQILIPVPLSKKRARERGYNQVTLVANKAVSEYAHIYVRTDVLVRKKHTVPQTSLSREKRIQNMRGVFALTSHSSCIKGKHIILLDDVTTTGATLKQAKATLLPACPASITCIAIAH